MARKTHRINARLSEEHDAMCRRLLKEGKLYGVHTTTDVLVKGLVELYWSRFKSELQEANEGQLKKLFGTRGHPASSGRAPESELNSAKQTKPSKPIIRPKTTPRIRHTKKGVES